MKIFDINILAIRVSIEGIIAVCATFIVLLSLVVSYWQLKIQRNFKVTILLKRILKMERFGMERQAIMIAWENWLI